MDSINIPTRRPLRSGYASQYPALFFSLGVTVIVIVVAIIAGWFLWRNPSPEKAMTNIIEHSSPDGKLRDQKGDTAGSIRHEQHDQVHKIVYAYTETAARSLKEEYHGWLFDPIAHEYRYTGQLYPAGDQEYNLVYTTEEDITRFTQAFISRESTAQPAAPTVIIIGGTLAENLQIPSPSPTPELSPSPEETSPAPAAE